MRFIDLSKSAKFIIGPSEGVRLIESRISLEVILRSYLFIEKLVISADCLIGTEHGCAYRCAHGRRGIVTPTNQPACQPLDYVFPFSGLAPTILLASATNNLIRHLVDSNWRCIRFLQVQQLLELTELPLEAHVWEDNRPSLAGKLECFLEHHVFLLHEVCDDATCAAAHASVAMNEDATLRYALLNEGNGGREVPNQARARRVRDGDHFVLQVLRKERLHARGDLKNVRDTCIPKHVEIRGCLQVTKIKTINYFIHFPSRRLVKKYSKWCTIFLSS